MSWEPISRELLQDIIANELGEATPEEREQFARAAVTLTKWQLSPWGDLGGGFWVVAVMDDRVLWYNDIEEGFNVSRFTVLRRICSNVRRDHYTGSGSKCRKHKSDGNQQPINRGKAFPNTGLFREFCIL